MRQLMVCIMGLAFLAFLNSCKKELSVENLAPATGTLQSSSGDCLPKTVAGSYLAAKALIDSNYIEVTVNVATPGPYTIYTDSLNGYYFRATGIFAAAGSTVVRLKGSGTPVNASVDDFTVRFDSSVCDISITVSPAGTVIGPATYSMVCNSFAPSGNYIKDTTLNTTNTVSVQVNVTAIGTYSITTNTVNGYSFSGAGNFSSTSSPQTVVLHATGKPVAAGTDVFTATAGTATCTFSITVTAAAPVTSPCGITPGGTYTAGTALGASNTVLITHTYSSAGPRTISTNTVNGYSFGPSNITATAGANSITLTGVGTPLAVGTNTFTVSFGDGQSCTFTVTVNAATVVPNTDYFPTTANSYWTYDNTSVTDTFIMTNAGPTAVYSGNTYQRFTYSDASGTYGQEFYRKNVAAGAYYRSDDTAGYGQAGLSFTQPRLDVLFLKNTLVTGDSLTSDFNAKLDTSSTATPSTISVIWRYKYKVINSAATVMINGKNFTNVYQLRETYDIGFMGVFFDSGIAPLDYYYVKGVGRIRLDYGTDIDNIRYWKVY